MSQHLPPYVASEVATRGIAVVSLSGGKDSTATALLAMESRDHGTIRLVFADTGHEHPLTIDYVLNYLPRRLNLPVEVIKADFARQIAGKRAWVEAHWTEAGVPPHRITRAMELLQPTGNPFLDLCLWKGRFPSRKAQFCTEQLKMLPFDRYMQAAPFVHAEHGQELPNESWRGIRRDESAARRNALTDSVDSTREGRIYRVIQPVVDWSAAQVFEYIAAHGVEVNPLYRQGMRRVGCMPCINCSKDELLDIAKRWPAEVERVRAWERLVAEASKRGLATFFADPIGDGPAKETYQHIDERVAWSKTSRGGRQFDLLRARLLAPQCAGVYGLCE